MRHTAIHFKGHTKPSCSCNVVDIEHVSRRVAETTLRLLFQSYLVLCQRVVLCSAYRVICPRRRTYWSKITLAQTGVVMSVEAG